ncbi:MAG: biotin/lipoate A/B protein ligase family protein [Alphaproteobacteria bacterium]
MTAALAELHRRGQAPDSLRFMFFVPSVSVGRHQSLAREVRLERCRARGVETARRITGGGAIYMDPGMLAWEIVTGRRRFAGGLPEATERLCGGVAAGLARMGIPARVRAPADVEAGGRKICGSAGYFDGQTLVLQGTVLVDFEIADMADALATADRGALTSRVTSIATLIGRVPPMAEIENCLLAGWSEIPGLAFSWGTPSTGEMELTARLLAAEIGTDAFVAGAEHLQPAYTQ